MPFLTPEELEVLHVEDLIFHVVGSKESDLILMDEVVATGAEVEHVPWFLDRLRSSNGGNVFDLVKPSLVLNALSTVQANPSTFVAQSRELATSFQGAHTGATVKGVLLLLRLSAMGKPLHALIKYDHEDVLSYLTDEAHGRRKATLTRVLNTFVKDPGAIQKACIIRLTPEGGEMAVRDRSNRRDICHYFRAFLGAKRRHTPESLTQRVVGAAKAAVTKHLPELGPDVARNLNQRLFDAVQATQGFDPDDPLPFLTAAVGPVPEGSKLPQSFRKELEKARVDEEAFDFDKAAVRRPRRRLMVTQEDIRISYPAQDANLIKEETRDGRTFITINSARVFAAVNGMMMDMLAAVAREDYEDRRGRQAQGIAKTRAANAYTGRLADAGRNKLIAGLLAKGVSWSQVQKATGCGRGTVAKMAKRDAA